MLVKFTSSTSGQILMMSPVARQLLEIVGKTCSARGVFTAEQLPDAIRRLQNAVHDPQRQSASPSAEATAPAADADEAEETRVGLGQRAFPLIELFERTLADEGFVMWEAPGDF
ncbi:MAG TPA: DUF1840 domain-containing protein [Accumulibacter sp.]|nr:DUF1840 domain-containing protein [Accumulibacter sp.]HMW16970.1 DUF1840 domain-containing protein [Accumulibacter sp.]HNC17222.1 DUF1840 domain-containing protein [Accumulibacter sp.]HND79746.1 DUF1840 domain-containing protein [Accumulibacter sp.]HNE13498.1 DUF1840 domain-containing protein [Accumulibacter sp.]